MVGICLRLRPKGLCVSFASWEKPRRALVAEGRGTRRWCSAAALWEALGNDLGAAGAERHLAGSVCSASRPSTEWGKNALGNISVP